MKWGIQAIRFVYSCYAFLAFVLVMLFVFPFVLLCLPFGKTRGGNWVYQCCRWWGGMWYLLIGMRHQEVYSQPHDTQRQYIFVANHISYMDIPAIVLGVHQPMRALGKFEMVRVPVFGWIYRAAVVLVDRSSPEKRAKSVRALKSALSKGISIFIFPEGTFNEGEDPLKSFYDGAFRLAIETGTPLQPILLPDTLKRLHYSSLFSLNPGPCRVIYLAPIEVKGLVTADIQNLKEKTKLAMEKGLKDHGAHWGRKAYF